MMLRKLQKVMNVVLQLKTTMTLKEGDVIEAFEMVEIKR